ncbi:MgtC/SapB family protein [Marinilactibacillus sp. XAAS-LB27]|uniref:MgtC/SapB family protein n=1 Tax=Marinilactibacillus sp. XAAS-LB27 TaxID=3114538 RepID=UPI002E17C5C1|nr:MgtC/SapB family protein [Marinilactibacillus sp. XAAS-LB27]
MAVVVGGIIGLERDMKNHAAGFRTYILVCLGSTVVMMTNQFISDTYLVGDPSRMGAQVISGIGFLGAGTILVTNNNHVRGLTTAAGLWSAACVGLAIGIGFYEGAIIGAFALLVIMNSFQRLKKAFMSQRKVVDCYILFETVVDFHNFLSYCALEDWKVLSIEGNTDKNENILYYMSIKFNNHVEAKSLVKNYHGIKGVLSVEEPE